jgi:hypothetical protein
MTNIAYLFGTLGGLVAIAGMLLGIVVLPEHGGSSLFYGYLVLFLAMSLIFFGVKRYRDTEGGGVIKFFPALMLGLAIAVVGGIIYVLAWEVYLAATQYAFVDGYANAMIEAAKAKGDAHGLEVTVKEMAAFKQSYANPLFRMPMTFLEIFPVGLVVAIVSAAILRNSRVLPAHA